jgi:ribA/ribD-fused uncharacterized protein
MVDEINFYRRRDPYGWMSNFYPAQIKVQGRYYASVEHYYQSQKAVKPEMRMWIANAPTAYQAAMAGRALREDHGEIDPRGWEIRKVPAMRRALMAKFTQHPDLEKQLLDTGDAILHEDSPTDLVWGKKGEDRLGKLLMEIRDELRRKRI